MMMIFDTHTHTHTIALVSPPREQFPVKVLMHGGQTIWEGRWAAAALWKTGTEAAAEFDSKGSLQHRQSDRAVQNKAE